MTLDQAIEEVKSNYMDEDYSPHEFDTGDMDHATAIATILNAVVKGELK